MSTALLVMWMWLHGQAQTKPLQIHPNTGEKVWLKHQGSGGRGEVKDFVATESGSRWPYPDLVDVPAVQETTKYKTGYLKNCRQDGESALAICEDVYKDFTLWTCADKSRVLLTSEDGTKHCIKFGV